MLGRLAGARARRPGSTLLTLDGRAVRRAGWQRDRRRDRSRQRRGHGLAHEVLDAAEIQAPLADLRAGRRHGRGARGAGRHAPGRSSRSRRSCGRGAGRREASSSGARVVDWRPVGGGGFEVEIGRRDRRRRRSPRPDGGAVARPSSCRPARCRSSSSARRSQWFRADRRSRAVARRPLPIWVWGPATTGVMYGLPYDAELGLKVSRHHWGRFVDPETVERAFGAPRSPAVRAFLAAPDAGRGRPAPDLDGLPLHEHAGRAVRDRHAIRPRPAWRSHRPARATASSSRR